MACLDLEILAGRQFSEPELTTKIICRNCADKNETIVKKAEESKRCEGFVESWSWSDSWTLEYTINRFLNIDCKHI